MYSIRDGFCYDDLLLVPRHSKIGSRKDIDISVDIKGVKYNHPIIPANMQSVCGEKMAEAVFLSGGLSILHRFMPLDEQIQIINNLVSKHGNSLLDHVGVSVGVKDDDQENVKRFVACGVRIFCIDIAHGDSLHCVNMTEWIRNTAPDSLIISGNVATGSGATTLWEAGADVVKAGVGGGSLCTTRVETGAGVPQMTAIMDVAEARVEFEIKYNKRVYIIADGGIRRTGDVVKSLCFADMVMVGNIFAGSSDSPGSVLLISGKTYKEYRGSSTHKSSHIEGVVAIVPTKDSFANILEKIKDGLTSGLSYQGVDNLIDLKDSPEFVKITNAGLIESHPHDVII